MSLPLDKDLNTPTALDLLTTFDILYLTLAWTVTDSWFRPVRIGEVGDAGARIRHLSLPCCLFGQSSPSHYWGKVSLAKVNGRYFSQGTGLTL
jgi:hypothetical protein